MDSPLAKGGGYPPLLGGLYLCTLLFARDLLITRVAYAFLVSVTCLPWLADTHTIGGGGRCTGDMATAPSGPTAPSSERYPRLAIFGPIWCGSIVFVSKLGSGTSKSTCGRSQNPISTNIDGI